MEQLSRNCRSMGSTWRRRWNKKRRSRSRPVKVGANMEFIQLCKWMVSNNWAAVSRLCPAFFPGTGRGLMAVAPIQVNELIVQIPIQLLITRRRVLEELPQLGQHLSTADLLSIYLVHCRIMKLNLEYLSSLPQEFSVAALCKLEELNTISPCTLKNELITSHNFFKQKVLHLQNLYSKVFHESLSCDTCEWAWLCVNTRAVFFRDDNLSESITKMKNKCSISAENNLALAPYLDMLNHSTEAEVEAGYNPKTSCYEIKALKKIAKYDQVFIRYGPHDNAKLFSEYGFVIKGNSIVKFTLDDISRFAATIKLDNRKECFLQQLSENKKFFCSRDGFSWDAQIALAILSMDDSELVPFEYPYQIDPDNYPLGKVLGRKIITNMIGQVEVALNTASNLAHITTSFEVAKTLMNDMLNTLTECLFTMNK